MPCSRFKELAHGITGPVYPVCPAFKKNGDLDLKSTEAYIRYLVENGASHLMLTAGSSRFNLLTHNEIHILNDLLVNSVNGDATTIVANPITGSTAEAITFAKQAQQLNADVLLVYYPERYYTDKAVTAYFSDISSVCPDVGVMAHAYPMRPAAPGNTNAVSFSINLISALCDIDNFIGMKEEHGDIKVREELGKQFGDQLSFIVAGAGMGMFVDSAVCNVNSYLVGIGSFKPSIEEEFYALYKSGRTVNALEIINKFETPFFNLAMPIGWHIAMKAALSLLDLMPIYERAPLKELSEEELDKISVLLHQFNWLD